MRRRLVAEVQEGDADQRMRIAIALQGDGAQLGVVGNLERGGQRGLLGDAAITTVSFITSNYLRTKRNGYDTTQQACGARP